MSTSIKNVSDSVGSVVNGPVTEFDAILAEPTTGTIDRTNAAEANMRFQMIDFKPTKMDLDRNPRLNVAYSAKKLEWLARNIFENGLLEPIMVNRREDGTDWVLKGHLRMHAIGIVRTEGLKAVPKSDGVAAKPTVEPQPNFMAKIKAIVLKGLTLEEELDFVMDHGTSTPLTRVEEYKSVKIMMSYGFTQELMAEKLGKSRPAVSKFVWVRRMPQCVEDLFLKSEDKDALKITDIQIGELYKAYGEDKDKKECEPKQAGPRFTKVWEKFVKDGSAPRVNALTGTALIEIVEQTTDEDLQSLLKAIARGDKKDTHVYLERIRLRMVPMGQVPPERLLNMLNTHIIKEGQDTVRNDGIVTAVESLPINA